MPNEGADSWRIVLNCVRENLEYVSDTQKSIALFDSPTYPSNNGSIKMKTSMEHWWNDTDRGKPKYREKNLSHCHCVHHISHMDWPGIERGTPWWEAGD
jgi:hypothetical protein